VSKTFYITTTLPYVNADPHVGFAMEILQADVLARWKRQELGDENVFFSTGTDEHGQKIFEAAQKAGKDVNEYVNHYANEFGKLKEALNLSYNKFIRTTDENHIKAAQTLWKKCKEKGDIYEKEFEGLYCVGCERFLSQRDITEGKCSIHQTEPQLLKEKNWFFKFQKYEKDLLKYLENPDVIIPNWRREEAINFVKDGLEDFSISRDRNRLSWGILVPDDDTQVMYVWFDALTNYISTLGWPNEESDFKKFWQDGYTLQMAGKDQVRFQSLMWQAMLMSADIKNTDQVFYHGFINSGGQKMSKSLGNVISPYELVEKYGIDTTRYLIIKHVNPFDDTDITWKLLNEWYEAHLVNGIGNLTARVLQMSQKYFDKNPKVTFLNDFIPEYGENGWRELLEKFRFDQSLDQIGVLAVNRIDEFIAKNEPFKKFKINPDEAKHDVQEALNMLFTIATLLSIFMPQTSEKILQAIKDNKKPENLFPRINA
jgi:methionyl-tRNA synthetase